VFFISVFSFEIDLTNQVQVLRTPNQASVESTIARL
jgi:hypothetical protein